MNQIKRIALIIPVVLLSIASAAFATDHGGNRPVADSVWLPIIEQIKEAKLDSLALSISGVVLKHVDFSLVLDSGTLFLFKPIMLEGKARYYGGYFVDPSFQAKASSNTVAFT